MARPFGSRRAGLLGVGYLIFVTIGSVFPFDRMIRLMDALAPLWPGERVFAQIGAGAYEPINMDFERQLTAPVFAAKLRESRVLVAHAGMGSVISALEARKPVVILPRRHDLGEHNTDHQMATARWLSGKRGIHVALSDEALAGAIASALASHEAGEQISSSAPPEFLARIRAFVDQPKGL
jgi:UDP-N-acetylglucosamine transferase subunit ALG13